MVTKRSSKTLRWYVTQMWRDLLSVYYANTPIWRWFKSAALIFLGFFLWTSGAVLLSVRPKWTVLHYVMAYGFLLLFWGPLTHFVVVPATIRLRRTARHPIAQGLSRNAGKINLAIFFALVIVLGAITPSVMLLEFAPLAGDGNGTDVRGDLVCHTGEEVVSCHIEGAQGIDHVVVTSGGDVVATADEPPFEFEVRIDELDETRTGKQFTVDYRDEEGETLRRSVRTV